MAIARNHDEGCSPAGGRAYGFSRLAILNLVEHEHRLTSNDPIPWQSAHSKLSGSSGTVQVVYSPSMSYSAAERLLEDRKQQRGVTWQ